MPPYRLVETPEGKLLWDTSCPRDWEQRWAPTGLQDFFPYDMVDENEYLDSRLNAMGVGLDEIDYVVLSHLHIDHAGNAGLFKNTNAQLICSDVEKKFALGFEGPFSGGHLKADYEHNLEQFYASVEKLRGIQEKTSAEMVFGHDADQIHQLRTAPEGSYT